MRWRPRIDPVSFFAAPFPLSCLMKREKGTRDLSEKEGRSWHGVPCAQSRALSLTTDWPCHLIRSPCEKSRFHVSGARPVIRSFDRRSLTPARRSLSLFVFLFVFVRVPSHLIPSHLFSPSILPSFLLSTPAVFPLACYPPSLPPSFHTYIYSNSQPASQESAHPPLHFTST